MKFRILFIMIIISVSTVFITGCSFNSTITGSDNTLQEEFPFTDFNAIDLTHSFNAEIIQSDKYKVTINYNSNLKELIEVVKVGNTLKIGLSEDHEYLNVKLSVKIYMPDITTINSSGASKITMPKFKTGNLKFDMTGASEIHAALEIANNLKINSTGASNIFLTGSAKNAYLNFSGASELSGKDMVILDNLNIDGDGASSVTLTADGKIIVDLKGASSVNYYGKGSIIKSIVTGASSIRKSERDTL